jgi:hypothetical protein
MACPLVVDGGNSLQMWRVAVNMLNKQLQKSDKGWSSSLGVEKVLHLLAIKNCLFMECYAGDQIKGEIGRAYSSCGRDEKCIQNLGQKT